MGSSCTGWVHLENFLLSYNKERSAEQLPLTYPEQQSSLIPHCKESPRTGLTPSCLPAWSGLKDLGFESRGGSGQSRSSSAEEEEDFPSYLPGGPGLAITHPGHTSRGRLLESGVIDGKRNRTVPASGWWLSGLIRSRCINLPDKKQ